MMGPADKHARYRLRNRVKILQKARAKYAANAEAEKLRHKLWADASKEYLRLYGRQRYSDDPEPKKEQAKSWRDRNPGRNAEACRKNKEKRMSL